MTSEVISKSIPTDYKTIESWLISHWEELLETQLIHSESDFFDLGADSLIVIRLLHRIEQTFGKNILSIDTLFENSQLRQIAKIIEESTGMR